MMKVLQTCQLSNLTKYEGITNRPTRKLQNYEGIANKPTKKL
jgi:hypothetical protein